MAQKTKSYEPYTWKDPNKLKSLRERLGLSQEALSKESGITRSVIANYESGRSYFSSVDDALKLYGTLELKERGQRDSNEASEVVLALLKFKKESHQGHLASIDGQLERLRRERKAVKGWLADLEAEEKQIKAAHIEGTNERR